MKHIELEQELKKHIRKHRIIEAAVSIIFGVIAIIFSVLYEQSRVVEEIGWGPFQYQSVTYNTDFQWGVLIGAMVAIPAVILLIGDFVFCKLVTFEVNGDYITFYRGLVHTNLYVNGELKNGCVFGYYLEAPLSDRTKVNVALGKWSSHFTFENGHQAIDV